MKTVSDLKWEVFEKIQNLGQKALLGIFTEEIIVTLENGKEIKINFEEVQK
jgi:hypothetical protein